MRMIVHGIVTGNYGTLTSYYSFPSVRGFCDVIQVCNLRTCTDYGIMFKTELQYLDVYFS